jgi:hypothetical protein
MVFFRFLGTDFIGLTTPKKAKNGILGQPLKPGANIIASLPGLAAFEEVKVERLQSFKGNRVAHWKGSLLRVFQARTALFQIDAPALRPGVLASLRFGSALFPSGTPSLNRETRRRVTALQTRAQVAR